jgi:hypothetical protein
VQQGGDQRGGVGPQIGEDAGDGKWMGYIGFTALAQLTVVRPMCNSVCPSQSLSIGTATVYSVRA